MTERRNWSFAPVLLLLATASALAAPPPLALVGGTLVDGTGGRPVGDSVVSIADGRIACAGTRDECEVPAGAEIRDVSGRWITPGLIDAHVHFSQTGWADGRPDFMDLREEYPYANVQAELRRHPELFYRAFLCSGVTAVFDVGGYPWSWDLRARAERNTLAPHVAASGPLLSTLDFWLNLPAERQFFYLADESAARDGVEYLASHGTDAVKVWFIAGREEESEPLAARVRAAGEAAAGAGVPLIVHATGLAEAKVAVAAGAHLLVHSVWDLEVDQELVDLLLEQGTIYNPTLTVMRGYQRMSEAVVAGEVPEVDDPNSCLGEATLRRAHATADIDPSLVDAEAVERRGESVAEREALMARNLVRLAWAGVPIAMGTDAGNPFTWHGPSVYAEMEAMQVAGLEPGEVVVAATSTAARAMGREGDLGTIEAGKVGDLLVLEADPLVDVASFRRLALVVRGGVPRTPAELGRPNGL